MGITVPGVGGRKVIRTEFLQELHGKDKQEFLNKDKARRWRQREEDENDRMGVPGDTKGKLHQGAQQEGQVRKGLGQT